MKIRLLATSDVHGMILPYRYSDKSLQEQGLARLSSYMKELRDENTLYIDNGDVMQGTPLDYFHSSFRQDEFHPMAKALNYLGCDYFNAGNHDFNFGRKMLLDYKESMNAPCLTGNVTIDGKRLGNEYTIHRFSDDCSIAIIGVVTQYIPNWEKPDNITGMEFENAFEYVKKNVEKIKATENVQGIVCVYHGGFERDLQTGEPTENLTGENYGYKMCREIDGLDVLISGHQHRSIAGSCCGKTVTQTAYNALEMACIEWDIRTGEKSARLIKANGDIDEDIISLVADEEAETQEWLDMPLGHLESGDLLISDEFEARVHKHPVISFLNEVQTAYSDSDTSSMALFNGASGFNNSITMRDLVSTYVFPNTIVSVEMNGIQMKQFLEKCAEYFDVKDGKICVSFNYLWPKPQHFNYDMVDGIEYTIKVSEPIGNRVKDIMYKGKPLQDSDILTMSMSNYRASGGGDFYMIKDCKVVKEIQRDFVECIAEYIQKNPVIKVSHKDNIKVEI